MADENQDMPVIEIENVCKSFHTAAGEVPILKNVSFKITDGDFLIIYGPSGSGKSTLLHALLGLEGPSTGAVKYYGKDIYNGSSEDERGVFRKMHIGMIYQQPNWIKCLTVIENVAFPLSLLGMGYSTAYTHAMHILMKLGMQNWANYRPTELSSGQQQRIALARALCHNPYIIVADEPTGNLDFESGQMVMQLLSDLNETENKTIIMVTHDLEYIKYARSAVNIKDGQAVGFYTGEEKEKMFGQLKFKRGADQTQPAVVTKAETTTTAPQEPAASPEQKVV
jgi:putative ABC transport system ATP-binding protein